MTSSQPPDASTIEEKSLAVAVVQFLRQKISTNEFNDAQNKDLEVSAKSLINAFSITDKNLDVKSTKSLLQVWTEVGDFKAVLHEHSNGNEENEGIVKSGPKAGLFDNDELLQSSDNESDKNQPVTSEKCDTEEAANTRKSVPYLEKDMFKLSDNEAEEKKPAKSSSTNLPVPSDSDVDNKNSNPPVTVPPVKSNLRLFNNDKLLSSDNSGAESDDEQSVCATASENKSASYLKSDLLKLSDNEAEDVKSEKPSATNLPAPPDVDNESSKSPAIAPPVKSNVGLFDNDKLLSSDNSGAESDDEQSVSTCPQSSDNESAPLLENDLLRLSSNENIAPTTTNPPKKIKKDYDTLDSEIKLLHNSDSEADKKQETIDSSAPSCEIEAAKPSSTNQSEKTSDLLDDNASDVLKTSTSENVMKEPLLVETQSATESDERVLYLEDDLLKPSPSNIEVMKAEMESSEVKPESKTDLLDGEDEVEVKHSVTSSSQMRNDSVQNMDSIIPKNVVTNKESDVQSSVEPEHNGGLFDSTEDDNSDSEDENLFNSSKPQPKSDSVPIQEANIVNHVDVNQDAETVKSEKDVPQTKKSNYLLDDDGLQHSSDSETEAQKSAKSKQSNKVEETIKESNITQETTQNDTRKLESDTASSSVRKFDANTPVIDADFLNDCKFDEVAKPVYKPEVIVIKPHNRNTSVEAKALNIPKATEPSTSKPPVTIPKKQPLPTVSKSASTATVTSQNSGRLVANKPSRCAPFTDDTISSIIAGAAIRGVADANVSIDRNDDGILLDYLYKIDQSHVVVNYNNVFEMKLKIAKSLPKLASNHLINFWMPRFILTNRLTRFADMILFCQYLQYHLEQYSGELHPKVYQQIIQAVVAREPSFEPHFALASNIPLMCELKFLCFNEDTPHIIFINPEVLKIQVHPLANGLPSQLMYCFTKQKQWKISELRETFIDEDNHEIYKQICSFINDRPDLVILEAPGKNRISFPHMMLRLNDRICPKLLCFGYDLRDVVMYERLHLRNDCIKSLKQFLPIRGWERR